MSFVRDLRVALHSLLRTPGLAIAVVLTLSLGIGANAAIFTLVRGVLLKPLVNRGEQRLIYIRQSAPGIRDENSAFSVPEVQDLRKDQSRLEAVVNEGGGTLTASATSLR
jgi:putative ABC transport system permease protein